MTASTTDNKSRQPRAWPLAALLAAMAAAQGSLAATTDLAGYPLFISSPTFVKPNVMFILDDSGSMDSVNMPDEAPDDTDNAYGYKTSQCNGVAYNPSVTYSLPVNADKTSMAAGDLDSVFYVSGLSSTRQFTGPSGGVTIISSGDTPTLTVSGNSPSSSWFPTNNEVTIYDYSDRTRWMTGVVKSWNTSGSALVITMRASSGSGTITQSNMRIGTGIPSMHYYRYSGSQAAMGYKYTTSGVTANTFYNECWSDIGSTPGSSVFTRVFVSKQSSEAQNYANWYTYYRKRYLMARSAITLAFKDIDSKFRIGFTTISDDTVSGTSFLNVADFDSTQKTSFYSKMWNSTPSSYTPLRGALAKAGQYFANKASGQTVDPVQYSCQKNYTILSTDGYWNTNNETTSYGPYKVTGSSTVGQQDDTASRPQYDGATVTVTDTTPYSLTESRTASYNKTTTVTWTRYRYFLSTSGCSSGRQRIRQQPQTKVRTIVEQYDDQQQRTGTYTQTVKTINGVTQSPTNSSTSWSSWSTTVTDTTATPVSDTGVPSDSAFADSGSSTVYNGMSCTNNAASLVLPSPNPSATDDPPATASSNGTPTYSSSTQSTPVAGSTSSSTSSSGGSSNSLADVAQYYYMTDLRTSSLGNCTGATGGDVCSNNVGSSGRDTASWQHMTTFTLGFGAGGTLTYDRNYLTQTSGDFYDITQGTKNWPVASSDSPKAIDDLWHAAVNGRGQYFSASDPTSLATSLSSLLSNITSVVGSGAGASTSTLLPVLGNNQLFLGEFRSVEWVGDLRAYTINATTGAVSGDTTTCGTGCDWSAQAKLDAKLPADRVIYYFKRGASTGNLGTLRSFTYANLTADSLNGYFDNFCSKAGAASTNPQQCSTLSGTNLTSANSGANLVNYLRGQEFTGVYRARTHKLGDLVNASPVFVGKPTFTYTEHAYSTFAANNATRTPVVYAAANDGMLHAFDAATGVEKWAYMPNPVLSNLYKIADNDFANYHQYYVDGTPIVGDIYVGGAWKTILVGGLRGGGRGYYALDITDPNNPVALWEFTNETAAAAGDADLGYAFGNPVITKRADGTWIVAITSGYNNVSSGDGNGHLYILNANTGAKILKINTYTSGTTPAGTATAPSGLGKLNAWIDSVSDNTTKRFYAGDLLGNLWRFDIDNLVQPNGAAQRIAYFKADSLLQPITAQPALAELNYNGTTYPVVIVGTGKYLGTSDVTNTDKQSVYAIKDSLTATDLGDVRASGTLVTQTITETVANTTRTVTSNSVNWGAKNGWMVDLISSGERVNVDMVVVANTVVFAGNIPSNTGVCESQSGGTSWVYSLDVSSGGAAPGVSGGVAGGWLGNKLVAGLGWFQLPDGTVIKMITGTDETITQSSLASSTSAGPARRTSWRELVN